MDCLIVGGPSNAGDHSVASGFIRARIGHEYGDRLIRSSCSAAPMQAGKRDALPMENMLVKFGPVIR